MVHRLASGAGTLTHRKHLFVYWAVSSGRSVAELAAPMEGLGMRLSTCVPAAPEHFHSSVLSGKAASPESDRSDFSHGLLRL